MALVNHAIFRDSEIYTPKSIFSKPSFGFHSGNDLNPFPGVDDPGNHQLRVPWSPMSHGSVQPRLEHVQGILSLRLWLLVSMGFNGFPGWAHFVVSWTKGCVSNSECQKPLPFTWHIQAQTISKLTKKTHTYLKYLGFWFFSNYPSLFTFPGCKHPLFSRLVPVSHWTLNSPIVGPRPASQLWVCPKTNGRVSFLSWFVINFSFSIL